MRSLIASEAAIQYKMELVRAGMVDGPSDAPLMTKIEKLRARNAAWVTGFPLHTIMVHPRRYTTVKACAGGFFLYRDSSELHLGWRLHRPTWPGLGTSGGLDERSWLLDLKPYLSQLQMSHIGACAVNPEEDMVVFVMNAPRNE